MYNPIRIFVKKGMEEEFVMIQGYVRSVTDQGSYNSVSFLVNTTERGPKAPLISVMCFDNEIGINFKSLTENVVGRFVTIFAITRYRNNKPSYKALAFSISPTEFKKKSNPIIDDEVQPDYSEQECEQLSNEDLPFNP